MPPVTEEEEESRGKAEEEAEESDSAVEDLRGSWGENSDGEHFEELQSDGLGLRAVSL